MMRGCGLVEHAILCGQVAMIAEYPLGAKLNPWTTTIGRLTMMFDTQKKFFSKNYQIGATTVEYVVVVTFLVILLLVVILRLVNPGSGVDESALPRGYKAIGDKVGQFGTLPAD